MTLHQRKEIDLKKKILLLTSIVLLLVCMFLPVTAEGSVTATVNNLTAHRGDIVTFSVSLSDPVEVTSGAVSLEYDKTALKLKSVEWKVTGALLTNFQMEAEKGVLLYQNPAVISDTIFTATFEVLDTAEFSSTEVSIDISLKDRSKKDISVTNNSGCLAVECDHADTNKDHKCDTCGKVLTECADANKDHNCDICGKKLTDHTGGKATCKEKATCSVCGQKYGDLADHTYKTTWSSDSANHWHECSVCGSKKDEAAHADANRDHKCDTCSKVLSECADANKDHKCDTCGKVLTECADANKDHNCDVCGKKLTDHTGGKATCKEKATCSVCGQKYGDLAAHTYKTAWSSDSANHWHECSVCGSKKDEAAHTPGAAATETTAQVCTVCNYVITPALGHTHSFTKRVDERYLKSKATCTAKAVYYYSCSCGAIGNSTFEYGELAEHTAMYFWSNDRTGHWHECSTCGKKLDLSVHIPNRASATETEPVVCTVCGYLIEAAHGHIHNITGYWEKDEENHWHSCTGCDLRFDLENHVFTLVADKRNSGSSMVFGHEECVTCGLKKGSLLYGIEPGTTVEKLKEALGKDIVVNGAKNGLIGTGTKVVVGGKEYTVIIKGDIDGDGKITATDYIRVRLHILKRIRLDGEKLLAAHASTEISKNVSAADYIAIRLHILKKKLIVQ